MTNEAKPGSTLPRRIKIAVLSPLSIEAMSELRARYDCEVALNPDPAEKRRILHHAEVVLLRSPVRLDEDDLRAAAKLKLIVRAGSGLDSIDVEFAERAGIDVVTTPLSGRSVAEHVFGLALSLYRTIPSFHQSMRDGRWTKHEAPGRELHGKTIGLLGLGRIGSCVARLASGFGMRILAFDRTPKKPIKQETAQSYDIAFTDLSAVFARSDVISVHLPLSEETRSLVDATLMSRMKGHAILINVGRGKVVVEDDLYSALAEHRIAGAASDVFSSEPVHGHPLLELENFVGTPHVGAQTVEAQQRVGRDVVRAIASYAAKASLCTNPWTSSSERTME